MNEWPNFKRIITPPFPLDLGRVRF
jgi:hypothetical protein